MSTWDAADLAALDRASEIRVAGRRNDGSLRTLVIVWHVVVDGALFVRSVRGSSGQWFRGVAHHHEGAISWNGATRDARFIPDSSADTAIDAAYFAKYGDGAPTHSITSAAATVTTLRVEPR